MSRRPPLPAAAGPARATPAGRRLPVYLLVDCSGSMAGEPLSAVQVALRGLVQELLEDPHARETAWLSVIAFGSDADQEVPLTPSERFRLPQQFQAGGSSSLGAALELLGERLDAEALPPDPDAPDSGDWRPVAFVLTDMSPTDPWRAPARRLRTRARLIPCGAGFAADLGLLAELGQPVLQLTHLPPGALLGCLRWENPARPGPEAPR